MNGFERRKEHSRESILQAALELFQAYGSEKVTINEIACKANVSQVTIYNHFGSKDDLVREVIITLLKNLLEKQRTIINGEGTFIEKLERIIFDKKLEMIIQRQWELMRAIFQYNLKVHQIIGAQLQQEFNFLAIDLFNEGKREGYINPDLSNATILAYYDILRRGILASPRLAGEENNSKLLHELKALFLHGIIMKME